MGVEKKLDIIQEQFNENINSHVFLIETDELENATNDVKKLIAHTIDADDTTAKQIMDENYIELIIIRPNGINILKDDISRLQESIKTKPILSTKKFYIIINADLLNDSAANKLLKTIEEPQEGIFGFLIAENISAILPTIKSRCQIEQLFYKTKGKTIDYNPEELKIAENIIKIIETGTYKELIIYKTNEKDAKDFLKTNGKSVANIIKDYYNNSCDVENNNLTTEIVDIIKKNNTIQQRINKATYLNGLINKTTINMNAELLIDKIILELKDVNKNADSRN